MSTSVMKSFFFNDTIVLPLYLGYISLRDVITAALLEERHMGNSQNTRRYLRSSITPLCWFLFLSSQLDVKLFDYQPWGY